MRSLGARRKRLGALAGAVALGALAAPTGAAAYCAWNGVDEGTFDNVVWDAAIEHFTQQEMADILRQIKSRLAPGGIMTGYTIVEKPDGKSHIDHEYEFKSQSDLKQLLVGHFANVRVFETAWKDKYESRRNLYFFASDGALPFDPAWDQATQAVAAQ